MVLTLKDRYFLTRETISCSDKYTYNWDLFNKGENILTTRINDDDFSEFSDEEREVLEEIFILINDEG